MFYQHKIKAIDDLLPYARNTRTHSEAQIAQVAASIKEFGFTNPVLIDEKGLIIAGHARVFAARKLKLNEVPCIVLDKLTEAQKKAYVIADNKLALNAGWDEELLKIELRDLSEEDFDLGLLGFTDNELESYLKDQEYSDSENEEIKEQFNILILCKDEKNQLKILEELNERGIECRALIS